jgi:hypothetical protein
MLLLASGKLSLRGAVTWKIIGGHNPVPDVDSVEPTGQVIVILGSGLGHGRGVFDLSGFCHPAQRVVLGVSIIVIRFLAGILGYHNSSQTVIPKTVLSRLPPWS